MKWSLERSKASEYTCSPLSPSQPSTQDEPEGERSGSFYDTDALVLSPHQWAPKQHTCHSQAGRDGVGFEHTGSLPSLV